MCSRHISLLQQCVTNLLGYGRCLQEMQLRFHVGNQAGVADETAAYTGTALCFQGGDGAVGGGWHGHRQSPDLFLRALDSFVWFFLPSSDCFAGHNSQKLEPSCFVLFAVLGVNCAASSRQSLISSFLHRSANTREASSVLFVPE